MGVGGMTFDNPARVKGILDDERTRTQYDPRNLAADIPSVVAVVKDTDKFAAFDAMLEQAHFFDTLEAE